MLETKRLIIKPLSHGQLTKYLVPDHALETELKINPGIRTISPELKEALEQTILPSMADSRKNFLFSTLWVLISKETNTIAGALCFTGEPNEVGEIEIGYGTHEPFRGQGLMTEAVGAMISWAGTQPNVQSIVASTDKGNVASYSILVKNSFEKVNETDTMFRWRLKLLSGT
jgi:[ribosomal protein S5]-alanine N-acetyltransferase